MTSVLVRGNVDTDAHRRGPCEHEGRNQSDAPTSQATPETASNPPEAGQEAQNTFSLTGSKGTNPAKSLSSDY